MKKILTKVLLLALFLLIIIFITSAKNFNFRNYNVSIYGNQNVLNNLYVGNQNFNVTNNGSVVTSKDIVANSHNGSWNGIDSTQFLRSDINDTLEAFTSYPQGSNASSEDHLVNKEYVDLAVTGLTLDYFLTNKSSDISGYYVLNDTDRGFVSNTLESQTLSAGNNQLIFNYSTEDSLPFDRLSVGVYDLHTHLQKTGGAAQTIYFYYTISKRNSSGEYELIMSDTPTKEITTSMQEFVIHSSLETKEFISSTDRIVLKFYVNVAGGGTSTVSVHMEGEEDCHVSFRAPAFVLDDIYLRQDANYQIRLANSSNITCIGNQCYYNGSIGAGGNGDINGTDINVTKVYISTLSNCDTINTTSDGELVCGDDDAGSGFVPYTGANQNVDLGANNFTVDTNVLYVDSTNNRVGIGTATPQRRLEIGNYGAIPAGFEPSILIQQDINHIGGVQMFNPNTGNIAEFRFIVFDSAKTHYIAFSTASPNHDFQRFGVDRKTHDYIFTNTLTGGTDRDFAIGTEKESALKFATNNIIRQTITSAGNMELRGSGHDFTLTDSGDGDNNRIVLQDVSGQGGNFYLYDDSEAITAHIRSYASSGVQAYFTAGNVGIGTSTPTYPLEVATNVSGISIWADANISAKGYITRTSIFDSSKNPFDYIKDTDNYLTDGEIDHKKFYGYAGEFEITDYSRPIEKEIFMNVTIPENYTYIEQNCSYKKRLSDGYNYVCKNVTKQEIRNKQICHNETKYDYVFNENKSYHKKIESEIEICKDIMQEVSKIEITYPYTKIEEGVSLNKEIDVLRQAVYEMSTELCIYNDKYSWCK